MPLLGDEPRPIVNPHPDDFATTDAVVTDPAGTIAFLIVMVALGLVVAQLVNRPLPVDAPVWTEWVLLPSWLALQLPCSARRLNQPLPPGAP